MKKLLRTLRNFFGQCIGYRSSSEEREEKADKKRRKDQIQKDSPSATKTRPEEPVRKKSFRERLFGKLVKNKKEPGSVSKESSGDSATTSAAGKNKKRCKNRRRDLIPEDSPSNRKTATKEPIRKIPSQERLFSKPVETKTVSKTNKRGKSSIAEESRGNSTVISATTSEAGKNKQQCKKRPKDRILKDSPSNTKTATKDPIRKIPSQERLFSKPVETKTVSKTNKRGKSSIAEESRGNSTVISATTSEAGKNKQQCKKRPKDRILKDSPSNTKTATKDPIRKIPSKEQLLSKPVETKTVSKTDKRGKSSISKESRGDSTVIPATATIAAGKNKKPNEKRLKDHVLKDSPSDAKNPTEQPIRKTPSDKNVFKKPLETKTISKTVKRGKSSISKESIGNATVIPATATRAAEEKETPDEKRLKDHVLKDSPSDAKNATEEPIRKTPSDEHLFKKPMQTKTVSFSKEDNIGKSSFSNKRRDDSMHFQEFAKILAGHTDERYMGEQEYRIYSIMKNDFGNYLNKSEPSTSQKPYNDLYFLGGSPSSERNTGLGFPNPAQICYMNSSLQSLLTLMEFITDISHQEAAWKMVPEAAVLTAFMGIVRCHHSPDEQKKLNALYTFKREVARRSPEFSDMGQKDAHEFLISFLENIEGLKPVMTEFFNKTERIYQCPVTEHLSFRMQNTRTCMRCRNCSSTEERFNNLSLNLVPQESVQDMLDNYLLETDTEYTCCCGGTNSSQQYSFKTLPRVLILHVKRFCYTSSWFLKKLHSNVNISRELFVSSQQGNGWYSVVSFISHLGCNANSGHYVSAGVQRGAVEDDATDSWVTYDDNYVTNVTGESVCINYQKNAYILFYKRRD